MNSTLVFCTSYVRDELHWILRYRRWLMHHRRVFPDNPLVLIDDGSPYLPADPGIAVNNELDHLERGTWATMYHFKMRLGRVSTDNFPGWFRSFAFSVNVADRLGCNKLIHIESDSFILSRAVLAYVSGLTSGWTSFWCPRWNFPESAFQVICEDCFPLFREVGSRSFATHFADRPMEHALPFTHVDKTFVGDRYGEYLTKVPSNADFAVQIGPRVSFRSDFD